MKMDMLDILRDGSRAAKARAATLRTDAALARAKAKRYETAARQYDEIAQRCNEMMEPFVTPEEQL